MVIIETPRQYWLLMLFRGIIAVLFGIMALISVEFTYTRYQAFCRSYGYLECSHSFMESCRSSERFR